ncbi:metallophosphoesterase [Bacteriovoracaceae bacterium]|nr:metallophosphoesterase [Bacteriovoracaceae bacterium]
MKTAVISDVHIKDNSCERNDFFKSFLTKCIEFEVKNIILLGDILDVYHGNYSQFNDFYSNYFKALEKFSLNNPNITIYLVDGNHDIHYSKSTVLSDKIISKGMGFDLELFGKKINFYHGDYLDYQNSFYRRYRKFINSSFFKNVFPRVVPFGFVQKTAQKASTSSKDSSKKYFDRQKYKEKYRKAAETLCYNMVTDYLVTGHTHIKDNYEFEIDGKPQIYINNGDSFYEKTFLSISDEGIKFVQI